MATVAKSPRCETSSSNTSCPQNMLVQDQYQSMSEKKRARKGSIQAEKSARRNSMSMVLKSMLA